jgi:mRNA interferase MazF
MPKRGEVWWVRLDPSQGSEIAKTRPCVVLSVDAINDRRRTVVVVPLSTSPTPHPPLLIQVTLGGRKVVAVVDQIRAVAKERLVRRLDQFVQEDMTALEHAVQRVLGFH